MAIRAMIDGVECDLTPEEEEAFISERASAPQPEPRLVRKSLIIDRLHEAGKLDDAYAVLQGASLYDRQRWESRDAIYFNDPTMLAALNAVGADPDVIMAPE
jgi:hypothetical protein